MLFARGYPVLGIKRVTPISGLHFVSLGEPSRILRRSVWLPKQYIETENRRPECDCFHVAGFTEVGFESVVYELSRRAHQFLLLAMSRSGSQLFSITCTHSLHRSAWLSH
jgi:hypothetical protein